MDTDEVASEQAEMWNPSERTRRAFPYQREENAAGAHEGRGGGGSAEGGKQQPATRGELWNEKAGADGYRGGGGAGRLDRWSRRSGGASEPASEVRQARRGCDPDRNGTDAPDLTGVGPHLLPRPAKRTTQHVAPRDSGSSLRGASDPDRTEWIRGRGASVERCGARRWRASTWRGPETLATGGHHRPALKLFLYGWIGMGRVDLSYSYAQGWVGSQGHRLSLNNSHYRWLARPS